ncbi:MAG: hypothetical protein IJ609_01490 [Paludibacteraceae bacterium]|nr:hypothetical protein [Paludibacteraceae bacterium]
MNQPTILIAEEGERSLIEKYLRLTDCPVIVTGVGALNIIRALRDIPRDTPLLNIGYCGSSNFAIGAAVVVSEARLNHPNVTYPEPVLPLRPCPEEWLRSAVCEGASDAAIAGAVCDRDDKPASRAVLQAVCYSNTDFVLQSDYRDCVFDMELAYIAALGFTQLSALKIVSDNLSLHAYHEHTHGVE